MELLTGGRSHGRLQVIDELQLVAVPAQSGQSMGEVHAIDELMLQLVAVPGAEKTIIAVAASVTVMQSKS